MIRSFCRYHRQERAGWSCSTCQAKLCPQCVASKSIEKVSVDVCATCGEQVAPLVQHRVESMSYAERLRTTWRYPFSLGGLVAMGAMGVLFGIGSLGLPYLALAFAVFWGFVFVLIQSSAQGSDDIGPPDFSSLWESVAVVLFRAVVASSASWVPLIFYLWSVKPAFFDALVDPILWLLVVFGLLYAPMAFMGAAVQTPLLRLLNPWWMVRCVLLLGRDYWRAVGMLSLLTVVQFVALWIASFIVRIPFPVVPMMLAFALLTYVPLVMARVVGLLLFVRGDKLGYGVPEDYYQRVVTDRPRGQLPAPKNTAVTFAASDTEKPLATETAAAIEVDF